MLSDYVVFRRSATCWVSFASANKTVVRKGLTREEARRICDQFNSNRTPGQVRRGTKFEFCHAGAL